MRSFHKKSKTRKNRRTHKKRNTKPARKRVLRTRRIGTKKRLNLDSVRNRYISPAEVVVPEVETVRAPIAPAEAAVSPVVNSQESASAPWSTITAITDASVQTVRAASEIAQPGLLTPLSQSPDNLTMTIAELTTSPKSHATTVETR